MSRVRDSQQSKVYASEVAAFGRAPSAEFAVPEMQALVDKWCAGSEVRKRYARANLKYTVTDGRSRRRGGYSEGSRSIAMPRATRTHWYLLHELAHALTSGPNYAQSASHGWEFCECFLYLVRVYMGRGAAETLEREFKNHKVRYKPPRTRTMTDEQREAARQRMLAYHRDRDQVAA